MMKITFMILWTVIVTATFAHAEVSLFNAVEGSEPLKMSFTQDMVTNQEDQLPAAKAATKPNDLLKDEQDAAKKKPSMTDNLSALATGFEKEVGGDIGKWFTEVKDGYKKIYDDGIVEATAKRNERIKNGETPTAWTDFKDGFTSTFIPSLKFSWNKWALPAIKTIFSVFG